MNAQHRTSNIERPQEKNEGPRPKPSWLRVRLGGGPAYSRLQKILHDRKLHTVCDEALCPNKGRCWDHGRATLMILGDVCTRHCSFCNVTPGRPPGCDPDEPSRVAEAVKTMGIRDVVITSVTRDDVADGGAAIWAETILRVHEAVPGVGIEVLVPDFGGSREALDLVLEAKPEVFGHNLETVPSLYRKVRPQADYRRSLDVLAYAHQRGFVVKTGIMVGLGESSSEVRGTMKDALQAGCGIFYIGQYLRPSKKNLPVSRYVEPSEFDDYRQWGMDMGFGAVVSAPLVRSSYHSEEQQSYVEKMRGERKK